MYYNLLVDIEDHPDPTVVLDQAATVDAPPQTKVEKRGPGQWQFLETVEIELVSREDGQVILDVFDATPVQFKALVSLIFQTGPMVMQIENDDGVEHSDAFGWVCCGQLICLPCAHSSPE